MKQHLGTYVAFIPLRGGSKSIPLKNIKMICGRPLVYWVLDAAHKCQEIDSIVVSTDHEQIREIVATYPSDKLHIIDRTAEVSTDGASTESVMMEFAKDYDFSNIILIQATSPLLTAEELDQGIGLYEKDSVDSVLSTVSQKRFLWKNGEPQNYIPLHRPRRQDFEGYEVENGAFYITSRERLLHSSCRISGRIATCQMDENSFFEIDEEDDFIIIEHLLQRRSKLQQVRTKPKIRCIITDSDGVLTDGGMYYSAHGDELKKFNAKDGKGFEILHNRGIITGIITGEHIPLVERRAEKLKVDFLYMGISDKLGLLDEICRNYQLTPEEIAYLGDDINDLEMIQAVGLGCAVADAVDAVKVAADYITQAPGGRGAFRELVEYITS